MKRTSSTIKALRVQLINSRGSALLPWIALSVIFLINLAIFFVARDAIDPGSRFSGALPSIYAVAFVANLQTWTQTFPFALGLSLTRAAFLRGAGLVVVGQSIVAGLGLMALKGLEGATNGWGMSLQFFALPYLSRDNPAAQFLAYALPYLALASLGALVGVVFTRWGPVGLYTALVGTVASCGGIAVLLVWRGWLGDVGGYFGGADPLTVLAGYPALLAAIFAGLTAMIARRATL